MRAKRGFTLVEILIVVIILGLSWGGISNRLHRDVWNCDFNLLRYAVSRYPHNAMLNAKLGNVYAKDDPARALQYYLRSTELAPPPPALMANIAAVYYNLGQYRSAEQWYRQIRSLNMLPEKAWR